MFSVIILNYNGIKHLPECLRSVRTQAYEEGYEIIVVNNLSTDGSLEYLRSQEDVYLINPGVNTGFSRGSNLGIFASRGEYILCLNFDCYLEQDFLKEIAKIFSDKPEVGAVSGKLKKLVNHTKTDFIDTAGISFHRCFPADRGEWASDRLCWNKSGFIFGPSGAAACYRRSALEDARFKNEYFDEDMFIYCEDIDLAWRLNLRGWKCWYTSSAIAYHERGSTRKDSAWERRNYFVTGFRNRLLGLYKNLRYKEDIMPYWREILLQEIRFILRFANNGFSSALIMLSAVFKALLKIIFCRRLHEKRLFIQSNLKNDNFSLGFGSPFKNIVMPVDLNLYELCEKPPVGKTIYEFKSIESFNIVRKGSEYFRDALAYGISIVNDPQFIGFIPEEIKHHCLEYLEFDLYSSHQICGQIIWLYKSEFCTSEVFIIHPGRKRYLLDLEDLLVAPGLGNPSIRNHPDRLRIDPTDKSGVKLAIYSLKIIENPKKDAN